MKEIKIEIPAGCEVEKVETHDGHVVVAFKEKERKLPKTWDEFCEMYPVTNNEYYIDDFSIVLQRTEIGDDRIIENDKNMLPDYSTAEAVLALCQLIQLRNAYNGDWVPDWNNESQIKFVITFANNIISNQYFAHSCSEILYFKSEELRDEFLKYFRPLVEKLKPLYGIMEGGEE